MVVPIKGFRLAKERLAPRLGVDEREALAMAMAARVISAASPLPVFVASDNHEVAEWATENGARSLTLGATGLNPAVGEAVCAVGSLGFTHAVIAHSDLPLARSFDHLAPVAGAEREVVLVPDRHRDGTNVLVTPTRMPPVFSYGSRSFHRHVFAAARAGHSVRVVVDHDLGWDIDYPEDLDLPGGRDPLDQLVPSPAGGATAP